MQNVISKIKGTIFGQAVGDALGLGTEFMDKHEVKWRYPDGLKDYSQIFQDSHRRRWERGQWTDDTDMMLCIANAFVKDGCINYTTVAHNFVEWLHSPTMMGIGRHTFNVLSNSGYLKDPFGVSKRIWEQSGKKSAANGALMRTSIIGVLKGDTEKTSEEICKLTHYDPRCICSCVAVTKITNNLIWNDKQLSINEIKASISGKTFSDERVFEYIDKAYNASDIAELGLDVEPGIGYTLKTLSAALWCLFHSETFESGLLSVVNEGGDADTNAAVACAVLGAKFGFQSIPSKYVSGLQPAEYLEYVTNKILKMVVG